MLKAGEAYQAKRKLTSTTRKVESKRAAEKRLLVENRLVLRQLRAEALLQGRHLTNADILAAGARPKRNDKIDAWAQLTPIEKELILGRSKAHFERQLAIGLPADMVYSPWTVLHNGAKWDTNISHSTVE